MGNPKKTGTFTGFILKLTGFLSLILLGVGAACYGMGWVTFDHDDETGSANIEIETDEMKDAAESALQSGNELLHDAGETIKDAADEATDGESSS